LREVAGKAARGLGPWPLSPVHVDRQAQNNKPDIFLARELQNPSYIKTEFLALDRFPRCCNLPRQISRRNANGLGAEIKPHQPLWRSQISQSGLRGSEQGGHDTGLSVFHHPVMTQPVGPLVDPLPPGFLPDLRPLHGRWLWMQPVSVTKHGADLFASIHGKDEELWTYMPSGGPFANEDQFTTWLSAREAARDPWFYAYINRTTESAVGMGSFMRADAPNGAIELGNIWFSPSLQKSREATEAIFLMIRHCFDDLGMRRVEWKCDALNAPSRKAALRFGFSFEGIFRQHFIIKGRNRDTAWFAMMDHEWPDVKTAFETWLQPENFEQGRQLSKLRIGQMR
jgi:RimJ/RimL family protein N-acetyltransferase